MILPQLLTLCSSLSLSLRVFICVCILSLWARYATVSRTCVSCRTPSRDSTRVTATADSANWRTCCKTLWYDLRFLSYSYVQGLFKDQQRTSGEKLFSCCARLALPRCLQICGIDCCAKPAFGVSIELLMNT